MELQLYQMHVYKKKRLIYLDTTVMSWSVYLTFRTKDFTWTKPEISLDLTADLAISLFYTYF